MIQSLVLLNGEFGRISMLLNLIWESTEMQCEEIRLDTRKNVPDRKDSSDAQSSTRQGLFLFKMAFTKKMCLP